MIVVIHNNTHLFVRLTDRIARIGRGAGDPAISINIILIGSVFAWVVDIKCRILCNHHILGVGNLWLALHQEACRQSNIFLGQHFVCHTRGEIKGFRCVILLMLYTIVSNLFKLLSDFTDTL